MEDVVNWSEVAGGECIFQKVGISEDIGPVDLPMYLTKDERKKLKRKRKH